MLIYRTKGFLTMATMYILYTTLVCLTIYENKSTAMDFSFIALAGIVSIAPFGQNVFGSEYNFFTYRLLVKSTLLACLIQKTISVFMMQVVFLIITISIIFYQSENGLEKNLVIKSLLLTALYFFISLLFSVFNSVFNPILNKSNWLRSSFSEMRVSTIIFSIIVQMLIFFFFYIIKIMNVSLESLYKIVIFACPILFFMLIGSLFFSQSYVYRNRFSIMQKLSKTN
jgi:hypothetical protein